MKNLFLGNAFSLQMIDIGKPILISVVPIDSAEVKKLLSAHEFVSAIGHQDTATVVSDILGVDVPQNRISISVTGDDALIVAQFTGGRLPEGATSLPDNISIKFFMVTVI